MEKKYCYLCKGYKPTTEYYKCITNKDGFQNRCKSCCKITNKDFRDNNPTYYWGTENSYFVKNYDMEMDYLSRWGKADKNCLIYSIEVNGRVYVGSTKRTKIQISNSLKQDYNRMVKYPELKKTPILEFLKDFSREEIYDLIDNQMVILRDFEGTRREMRIEMVNIMREIKLTGKEIVNKRIN
jgi:hypothetical protein